MPINPKGDIANPYRWMEMEGTSGGRTTPKASHRSIELSMGENKYKMGRLLWSPVCHLMDVSEATSN